MIVQMHFTTLMTFSKIIETVPFVLLEGMHDFVVRVPVHSTIAWIYDYALVFVSQEPSLQYNEF
jgi:hypothetical protein